MVLIVGSVVVVVVGGGGVGSVVVVVVVVVVLQVDCSSALKSPFPSLGASDPHILYSLRLHGCGR
jgi:hypothetical protein